MNKLILNFKSKDTQKIKNPKNFLGGKGANLSEMGRMGLPVPPGFTISTKVCEVFYKDKKKLNSKLINQIKKELKVIEKDVSKKFGDLKNPLLLSVRSGARVSMPGMMDTILNLGLNDKTVIALANKTSNGRFAKDSYRRFIQMYGNVVMGVEGYHFEELIENYKLTKGVLLDTDLDEDDWDGLIKDFKNVVKEKTNKEFPQDVNQQLLGAISAVFLSWESKRAKVYRKLNQIPSEWGTAVNVQSMVFGNMGNDCATGVVFTRNPSDGSNDIYGEYLINAQGEDVVAGTRTPQYITKKARQDAKVKELSMEESMPKVFKELQKILKKLEMHYKDMRRFGTFRFCSSTDEFEKKLASLGPDILAEDVSDETFMHCMRRYPNRTVVQSLMDQKVLAGVGNYIKAEALYRAGISPHRVNSSLTDEELVRLNQETKWVIRASYASRGARISTYELPDGSTGTYNFKFLVYRRKTDPAGLRVVREQTRDKRTTHWVPERQH